MKTKPFLIMALSIAMIACESQPNNDAESSTYEGVVDGHNSRTSLDWSGTYQGTVPCADCEGIQTSLTLFPEGNYNKRVEYLGKDNAVFTDEGQFEWNEAGSAIALSSKDGSKLSYQVGEGKLIQLDIEGNKITGELAGQYVLLKNKSDARLENKKWILDELMGKAIEIQEGGKRAALQFSAVDGRMAGNDGCNNIMGTYQLKEGNQISFGKMAGTLMACPDMESADRFRELLEQVDNYNVSDSSLVLNKARMAPLMRFVPVEE